MKHILFDTSALIALYIHNHPNHENCLNYFLDQGKKGANFFLCSHSAAEFYRNITSGRKYLSYTPSQAHKLINQAINIYFEPVTLDYSDYVKVIEIMKKLSLHGAVVYDGLIARAAEKAECKQIVTYNVQDFQRIWPLTSANLIEP